MLIEELLVKLDNAFNENDLNKAENIIKDGINTAVNEADDASLLQLLNEYIGFLRSLSRHDEACAVGMQIEKLMTSMNLEGSIPYATSFLNIATALRAAGRYDDALSHYNEVERIYLSSLPDKSMLLASFYNNKSLLFQETGDIDSSIECLKKALDIALYNNEQFEIAVSYSNLANSYAGLHNYAGAYSSALNAIAAFDKEGIKDSHYASALYVLGICENNSGNYSKAKEHLEKALIIMEQNLGRNEYYYRIADELNNCGSDSFISGMELAHAYYREIVKPAIEKNFNDYVNQIAVGLVGRGSDCYKYDDASSMDHDWGPGLCIWISRETNSKIGEKLTDLYNSLPSEFKGFKRGPLVSGHKRKGVFIIEDFYRDLLGEWPVEHIENIPDYAFSAAVNGEVFTDPEGKFSEIRSELQKGYPSGFLFRKIADSASKFSQAVQYNLPRMLKRGDNVTASMMLSDGIKEAMKLAHYIENKYPPHDKWLYRSLHDLNFGADIVPLINMTLESGNADALSQFFADTMYSCDYISDVDDYLDHHADELLFKSVISDMPKETLVKKIVELEFEAFDKVENEGGRADCQDDWMTFSKMRKSQYLTWNKTMLMQYLYDFNREFNLGHNLITEKYGRMMASTAPFEYEKIKDNFPAISDQKAAVSEAIVKIQVEWMEDFSLNYPKLAGRARSIHSFEDTPYNTSYETYLRGEILTYSDKMLQLYAAFIKEKLESGSNLAYEIMTCNCKLYGYDSLDSAEEKA